MGIYTLEIVSSSVAHCVSLHACVRTRLKRITSPTLHTGTSTDTRSDAAVSYYSYDSSQLLTRIVHDHVCNKSRVSLMEDHRVDLLAIRVCHCLGIGRQLFRGRACARASCTHLSARG